MEVEKLYALFKAHPQIVTDTRKIVKGGIFFALKGANFDGNLFAQKALEEGCSYAVVEDRNVANGERILLTDNVLATLTQLATYHRVQWGKPLFAITGTNGKTTTKELIAQVLQKRYSLLYTEGNLNNQIGVPLTLLRLQNEHDFAVIEMGANHPDDIKELVEIARPNCGLITNIGKAHLQGFGSFEGVKKAKGALYAYLKENGGKVYLNASDNVLMQMVQGDKGKMLCRYYGNHVSSILSGEVLENEEQFACILHHSQGDRKVKTQLIGDYNLPNVLGAVAVGLDNGVELDEAIEAIETYTPSNMRSQYKETAFNRLIIDAYNANPTSMYSALQSFSHFKGEKKMVIVGDMKELGEESVREHQKIVDILHGMELNEVLFCGEEYGKCRINFGKYFPSTQELCNYLKQEIIKGATLLIKGSRSMQLEKCVEFL